MLRSLVGSEMCIRDSREPRAQDQELKLRLQRHLRQCEEEFRSSLEHMLFQNQEAKRRLARLEACAPTSNSQGRDVVQSKTSADLQQDLMQLEQATALLATPKSMATAARLQAMDTPGFTRAMGSSISSEVASTEVGVEREEVFEVEAMQLSTTETNQIIARSAVDLIQVSEWTEASPEESAADAVAGLGGDSDVAVSYTHLTLPTKRIV
eukprot:TRINITY_DN15427_c0_g1_i2.p1 TRINITY_DN15427_c0_g1~~TRINITY_DN15427_c0_g1_i2.p1  ORF type:complete len:243 (+),score=64.06 TRINITY_DN15427_c0_g1_i2:102-731(+)